MPRTPLLKALLALLLFGSVPCTVKYVGFDPIAIGILRLSIAAIGLTGLLWSTKRLPSLSRSELKILVCAGLFFGGHWLFYFFGIKLGGAAIGALGFSTYGIQLALLGSILKLHAVQKAHGIALLLAIVGSVLIISSPDIKEQAVWGLLSGILSGTFYALLPVLHQRNQGLPDEVRALGQFAFALLVFLPLLPYASFSATPFDWLLTVYLGLIVTLIGHTLWVQASTAMPTSTTGIVS
jgi:drug/metabolite transporter (DMT)-like permease